MKKPITVRSKKGPSQSWQAITPAVPTTPKRHPPSTKPGHSPPATAAAICHRINSSGDRIAFCSALRTRA